MRNILKHLILIVTASVILGCNVDITPTNIGTDTDFLSSINNLEAKSNNITGTNFKVSSTPAISSEILNGTTYDVITVSFANGRVDDTTANLANIVFYPLTDAADNKTPYTRGAAISFTSAKVIHTGDNTKIEYRIDNASTAFDVTKAFEIVVSANITAYNSAIKLNQDNDNIEGETVDDIYVSTVSISVLTTGKARNLPSTAAFAIAYGGINTSGDVIYTVTSALSLDTFSSSSLNGGLVAEKYNYATHKWSVVTVTTSYINTTGIFTIDLPAVTNGDAYRWQFTKSLINQDKALIDNTDYQVKYVVNNQNLGKLDGSGIIDTGGYYTNITTTPTRNNTDGNKYIDINFTGATGDIIVTTLINNNIKFYLPLIAPRMNVYIEFDSVEELTDNNFRFHFTTGLNISGMKTIIYPTVMEDAGTPDNPADDLHIGNSANPLAVITL